ncbi:DUF1178 family protein [Pseudogemmobacter faecipullorum]|uniref:DUF1178 family protein n=1 Tax=Pseudogemmobacter faecipullorum TaxID=2755041 RepID=A0ABS8CMN0_9RHOB|nr:DUF1178 family protein [Pseudogemmobacter faecipullorum]MCB5410646.1 DUF1178 family protein [Pseudogemmobacter faecipullorum]
MIRYSLRCLSGHNFESWFADAAAYDGLSAAGHIACPDCGSSDVEKALMVPSVRPARSAAKPEQPPRDPAAAEPAAAPALPGGARAGAAPTPAAAALPAPDLEKALAAMRREFEANSEYVGKEFASEARRIHEGAAPERVIYGEVRAEEARALIEEGVPVAPLPFTPRRKLN